MTMFPPLAKPALVAGLLISLAACGAHNGHGTGQDARPVGSTKVYNVGNLSITGTWASTGKDKGNSAAYMKVSNTGPEQDTLLSVATSAAQFSEVHQSLEEDGVSMMRKVRQLPIEPGSTVVLEPGSYHIMLIKLNSDIVKGTDVPLTLSFEKAGDVEIMAPALKAGGGHHNH